MVRKNAKTLEEKIASIEAESFNPFEEFSGDSIKVKRRDAGVKLSFEVGEMAILRHTGVNTFQKGKESGTYLRFFDGSRSVSLSQGRALSEVEFLEGKYYFISCPKEIKTGKGNPMKDIAVIELGSEDDLIRVPKIISSDGKLILTDGNIREVNYERINYPLSNE
ncbi:MAG: hypothetical protein PHN89_05865 [Candidatus Pacebacteria bacterium]|nr:hypothetical protein [Candidatus Paceibacterota bacterium]